MGWLEKVTGISFDTKGSAPGKAVLVKTEDPCDTEQNRENEMYHAPGVSSAPTKGDRAIALSLKTGARVIIASHNYQVEVEPSAGETIIYSTNSDGDTVKAKIKLDNDGQIIVNDGEDYAVAYEDLKDAFDQLVKDHNALVTKFNSHTHTVATTGTAAAQSGTAAVVASQASSSSADMSGSKIEKVRMP
ncbi:MAG: hypothetical protein PQJ46_09460 [Spirochaetales bacterium]|nr:hypothetical protein [Spirochaetales bacterium]